MKTRTARFVLGATLAAAVSLAHATPITVANSSFELPDTPTFTYGGPVAIDYWSLSSGAAAGVFQADAYPGAGAGFIAGVVGTQTAFVSSGSIFQTVGSLAAGTYTLKVKVGDRAGGAAPNYSIALVDGAAVLSSITQANFVTLDNGWIEALLTYSIAPGSLLIGDSFGIRLASTGGGQVNFDNVRLDFDSSGSVAAVPEPGTIALLGIALLGMGATRRRR